MVLNNRIKELDSLDIQSLDEAQLVKLARTDTSAFGELYDRTYDRILNYIYRRISNITTAEELTSNTYFKALKAFKRYRYNPPFIAWLYKIATNEIRLYYRSSKRQVPLNNIDNEFEDRIFYPSDDSNYNDGESMESRIADSLHLQKLLSKLPVKYQDVITLRYYEELSLNEISIVTGKRLGTVKSLLSRGLERLKEMINEEDKAAFIDTDHNYKKSLREVDGR